MPGVGRKSAQRIAFQLLERDREGATNLSRALADAVSGEPRNYLVIGSDSRAEINSSDPMAGVMLGGELIWGERRDISGDDGYDLRAQFSVKVNFPRN